MDSGLLTRFFGTTQAWHGPCTIIVDADAIVSISGPDSIVSGGVKMYAPRLVSGRIQADAVCLIPKENTLVIVQQNRTKQQTGEEQIRHTVYIVDTHHVIGIEFSDLSALDKLGLTPPEIHHRGEYRPGTLVG